MRIGYLLPDPGIGIFGSKGASVHAQEMIRAFRALGHEVTVFCTKRGDKHEDPTTVSVPADLTDLPVFVVPVSGVKGAAEREAAVVRVAARMAELAGAGGFDLLYERYSLFSTAGVTARRSSGVPLVIEVNAPLLREQKVHRSLHDEPTAERTTRESFTQADLLSCVSEPVADWARRLLAEDVTAPGRTPRVRVTPNGVDPTRFTPRHPDQQATEQHRTDQQRTDATARLKDAVTIGFLGTLKPWHGTDLLLRAFARIATQDARPRLRIIGGGPERRRLESLAAELGIGERVEFTGPVSPAQVPQLLAGLDIATAPYPAPSDESEHYFSPLKVYEYLAAGLPVIASALGELPQLLDGGRAADGSAEGMPAGITLPPGDPEALARALDRLIADPARRAQMGAAGRRLVEREHSWVMRAQGVLAQIPVPTAAQR